MTDILTLIQQDPNVSQSFKDALPSRAIPADAPPYAKLDPTPSDIRMAAEAISLILSVARIDCERVIEQLSADINKPELIKTLHNYMSDCNGDVTGPIEKAAEELQDARYDGTTRGPFYRAR